MPPERFSTYGSKKSPSGKYTFCLFQDKEANEFTFNVMNQLLCQFFHPLEEFGELRPHDLLDWSADRDILFFSTNDLRRVYLLDLLHFQFRSYSLREREIAKWDNEKCRWIIYYHEFGRGDEARYSTSCYIASEDAMAKEPPQKIVRIPDSVYSLWLRKRDIWGYDRPVWQISIFNERDRLLTVEDLGYYALEDSVRVTKDGRINFYGRREREDAVLVVNLRPGEALETKPDTQVVNIQEFADKPPMNMVFEDEIGFWRPVIDHEIIRPRPFYYDQMYREGVPAVNKPFPLQLMELVLPESEETGRMREESNAAKREAAMRQHAQNNTSTDDLLHRADSPSQLIQRHKTWRLLRRKTPGKKYDGGRRDMSGWMLALVTILATGLVVWAVILVSRGGSIGGNAMRNIATAVVGVLTLWGALIVKWWNNRH